MLIDTHAHLDSKDFNEDRRDVIKRAEANQLKAVISCGTTLASSRENVKLAQTYPIVFAAVGIHPHEAFQIEPRTIPELKQLARSKKVAAIGETGLDYYYNLSLPEIQRKAFALHIEAARELRLPLIIHCRQAEEDMLKILNSESAKDCGGVLHSFTGSRETAEKCVAMGFYVGVSGIMTFKGAGNLTELFTQLPLERLVLETDSPYLAPVPMRGKRNEPSFVLHTAAKLAKLRNLPIEEIQEITTKNAQQLFRLPA